MLRRRLTRVLTLICLAVVAQGAAIGSGAPGASRRAARAAYAADQIVVRSRPGVDIARLGASLAAHGLTLARRIPGTRLFSVRTNGRSPVAAIHSLAQTASIDTAVPDYTRNAFDTPNDPYFSSSESYLETIRAPQAWDLSHGSRRVTIAVVDSGVSPVADLSHQLLPGWNTIAGNSNTLDDTPISHGTLVAGVAAATTNNGLGIAGVAWDVNVLPVKVLTAQGGNDFQIGAGIVWAVDHGATVINLSLGGRAPGSTLCDVVDYALSKGAVVVAAAGNDRSDVPVYPAACPGVIAVSATDTRGDFASFSNYGPWVTLAAPGVAITSTRTGDAYGAETGTSLAAPMVAAVAALLQAQHPDWSPSQVATQLETTATDRGPVGFDPYYGYGLLDAYAALGGPVQAAVLPVPDAYEPNDLPSEATMLVRSARATISPEGDVDWYAVRIRAPGTVTFHIDSAAYDPKVGPFLHPLLQFYDAGMNLLATRDDVGFAYAHAEYLAARVFTAGRYYLRVANANGAKSLGAYSLTVTTVRSRYTGRLLFP